MPQLRAFAALLCLGAPLRLAAEEPAGTLKKIRDSGVIALGHRESSIPFSYYDDKQQVVGYSQDVALRIVDAVKQ
jgi:glutamate/aspartate transport system substrate-binding protein